MGSADKMEIAADTKIPISTVYRRLQTLHDNKFMAISGMISDDGKKFFYTEVRLDQFLLLIQETM